MPLLHRLLLTGLAAFCLAALPARAQQAPSRAPGAARPLGEALVELAERRRVNLLYDPGVVAGATTAQPVSGGDPGEILDRLLRGTGLRHYRLASGTYVIAPPAAPPAPGTGGVSGVVLDAVTGRPMRDAHVLLAGPAPRVAVTDAAGTFRFEAVPPGRHPLRASFIGYDARADTVAVAPGGELRLVYRLVPEPVRVEPVEVEGVERAGAPFAPSIRPGEAGLPPAGVGAADVIRALDDLAGVQAGTVTADLHLQGGETGEHRLLLDGTPVFEPVHLRGLLGAFSPLAVRSVTVHKAGFGAPLGSHAAGVILAEQAIESPDGHRLAVHLDALSLDTRLQLAGPDTGRLRAQLMVALRTDHGMLDRYTTGFLREWNRPDLFLQYSSLLSLMEEDPVSSAAYATLLDDGPGGAAGALELGFTDLHAGGRLQLGATSVYASLYRSRNGLGGSRIVQGLPQDGAERAGRDRYDWRNDNGQVTFTTLLGRRAVGRLQLRNSHYALDHRYVAPDNRNTVWLLTPDLQLRELRLDTAPADDGNFIRETAVEAALDAETGRAGTLRAGAEAVRSGHRFRIEDVFFRPIADQRAGWRLAAFAEQTLRPLERLRLTGGLRLTRTAEHRAPYAEPRFSVELAGPADGARGWSARFAGGLYRQFVNQFDMSSISPSALAPSIRFWLPVDSTVAPPLARHLALGVEARPGAGWTLYAELYHKRQSHLLSIDYAALWQRLRSDEPAASRQAGFLEAGSGHGYGGALSADYRRASGNVRLRYEYGRARRRYGHLGVEPVDAPWNEPHRLDAALDWIPRPPLRATLRWKSILGRSWGFRRAYYDYLASGPDSRTRFGDFDLRAPEHHRLPDFHQLDLGAAYRLAARGMSLEIGLQLLNALDRANVADWSLDFTYRSDNTLAYDRTPRALAPRTVVGHLALRW